MLRTESQAQDGVNFAPDPMAEEINKQISEEKQRKKKKSIMRNYTTGDGLKLDSMKTLQLPNYQIVEEEAEHDSGGGTTPREKEEDDGFENKYSVTVKKMSTAKESLGPSVVTGLISEDKSGTIDRRDESDDTSDLKTEFQSSEQQPAGQRRVSYISSGRNDQSVLHDYD